MGRLPGNHSQGINNAYWNIANWLGDPRRVIGYGNVSDLNNSGLLNHRGLTHRGSLRANPDYPGKIRSSIY